MKAKKISVMLLAIVTLVTIVGRSIVFAVPSSIDGYESVLLYEAQKEESSTEVSVTRPKGGVTFYQKSIVDFLGNSVKGTRVRYDCFVENGVNNVDCLASNQQVSIKMEEQEIMLTHEEDPNSTMCVNMRFDGHVITGDELAENDNEIVYDSYAEIVKSPTKSGKFTGTAYTTVTVSTINE